MKGRTEHPVSFSAARGCRGSDLSGGQVEDATGVRFGGKLACLLNPMQRERWCVAGPASSSAHSPVLCLVREGTQ